MSTADLAQQQMGKQPVQSTGPSSLKDPRLGLMLCCCLIEILSNFLNKGSLYFHFAFDHTNYAPDRGQCVDAEKPCSRL